MSNEVINQIREVVWSRINVNKFTFEEVCDTLKWFLGGSVTDHYNEATKVHYFVIINDDIGDMVIDACDDAFKYEPLQVRISRMCEEYNGYMNYKFRDSEEYIAEKERLTC